MLSKKDLEALAQTRFDDAQLLLHAGRSSSAYYLAGYAVELALKACIAKLIQSEAIPDKALILATYTHELDKLLSTAELRPEFTVECNANTQLAANWAIVTKWNEASRYQVWDAAAATSLIDAVGEPNNGVFQWLKKHW